MVSRLRGAFYIHIIHFLDIILLKTESLKIRKAETEFEKSHGIKFPTGETEKGLLIGELKKK